MVTVLTTIVFLW